MRKKGEQTDRVGHIYNSSTKKAERYHSETFWPPCVVKPRGHGGCPLPQVCAQNSHAFRLLHIVIEDLGPLFFYSAKKGRLLKFILQQCQDSKLGEAKHSLLAKVRMDISFFNLCPEIIYHTFMMLFKQKKGKKCN